MQVLGLLAYEKLKQIGVGQCKNSEVFLARDLQHGGIIAVKEIPKDLLRKQGIKNVFQEAQVMFAAKHPQNVAPILYACDLPNADAIGLAMPYYANGSLQDRIVSGPVSPLEVIRVGLAMLTGLGSIHAKNLLHFDLKPSNILFDDRNEPLVADFGQTRAVAQFGKAPMPPMYPDGIPPEFYTSGVGSFESDIYHAGLTLYRAANGHPHFLLQRPTDNRERESRTLGGTFPRRDKFMPHVPKQMCTLIRKALSVDPAQRFRSASDMWNALANCDVQENWTTRVGQDGECSWECPARNGRVGRYVELLKNGKRWNVAASTDGATRRLVKTKCLTSASRQEAELHLKSLFAEEG